MHLSKIFRCLEYQYSRKAPHNEADNQQSNRHKPLQDVSYRFAIMKDADDRER